MIPTLRGVLAVGAGVVKLPLRAVDAVTDANETTRAVKGTVLGVAGAAASVAAGTVTALLRHAAPEPDRRSGQVQEPLHPVATPPEEMAAAAREAGAPGAATAKASRAVDTGDRAAGEVSGEDLAPEDLPLEDYDHLTLGSLRARMRRLSVDELSVLRAYERAHADRIQVVTMLENRMAKVAAQAAAEAGARSAAAQGPAATPAGTAASGDGARGEG